MPSFTVVIKRTPQRFPASFCRQRGRVDVQFLQFGLRCMLVSANLSTLVILLQQQFARLGRPLQTNSANEADNGMS